jgi:hypothetical protein
MRQPSIGQAIGLQGRDQNAEKLGNLVYQMGQAEANRQLKKDIYGAKKAKEDEDAVAKKFDLPTGKYHRLVVGDMVKTQEKYVNELKNLKLNRPNDWQNSVSDLAMRYDRDMSILSTRSTDLDKYDIISSSQDKGGSYFTKNWNKFNEVYEKATDFNDLVNKLDQAGWQPDAQLQLRPNGSVSYTPFRNAKPKETLEKDITQRINQVDFKSSSRKKAYGYQTNEVVKIRPVTREPSEYGVSLKEISNYNPNLAVSGSIEDVVDEFLTVPQNGFESVIQYADQNGLKARFDENGQLVPEDYKALKENIMGWAKNFASPTVSSSFMKPQTIFQAATDETSPVTADLTPGALAGTRQGIQSQKLGIINYSFDKEPQSIDARPSDTFTEDYEPSDVTTLKNVQANGIVVLATDAKGNPVKLTGTASDKNNVQGADVFVRLQSPGGFYYKRLNNYANISNQFLKKPNSQLEAEVKKLIKVAAAYDVEIPKRKKNTKATFEQIVDTPTF